MTNAPTASPEARRRAYERIQAERAANGRRIIERMRAAYHAEPDRDYAEAMWGDMLRERGVTP